LLSRGAHQGGLAERNALIDRTHPLPVRRPCHLLKLARSPAYDPPTPVSETGLALMRQIGKFQDRCRVCLS
jgi:hypothetical protein